MLIRRLRKSSAAIFLLFCGGPSESELEFTSDLFASFVDGRGLEFSV